MNTETHREDIVIGDIVQIIRRVRAQHRIPIVIGAATKLGMIIGPSPGIQYCMQVSTRMLSLLEML